MRVKSILFSHFASVELSAAILCSRLTVGFARYHDDTVSAHRGCFPTLPFTFHLFASLLLPLALSVWNHDHVCVSVSSTKV